MNRPVSSDSDCGALYETQALWSVRPMKPCSVRLGMAVEAERGITTIVLVRPLPLQLVIRIAEEKNIRIEIGERHAGHVLACFCCEAWGGWAF